mgnify:CR=1 FL=1|jgi:signal transduction histidine kinase|tara:strand:+ start:1227 stop:2357 length:1131 start_codon:yes stop_codon:yes gene_type:complete
MDDLSTQMDILEQLPRGVIVLETDSSIRRVNLRASELLSLSYGIKIHPGDSLIDIVDDSERDRWLKILRPAFSGNDTQGEVRRELDDGTTQVLRLDAQLLRGEGEVKQVVLIVEDVSARRLYENELLSMHSELRESTRTRDTILSIIGHDLRSPISQLNALMYMLRYSPDELDKAKMNEYAGTLEESTRHLSDTLNNLLGWSSVHRDGIQPKFHKVDLVPVAEEALGLLQLDAARKEVTLIHEPPAELFVTTDRDLMAYVVRNLVANAIKFSSVGGTVRVEHRLEDGCYYLGVIDRGVGMQSRQIEKVLMGEQLESTTGTLGEKGVGLGLSLTREFVAMLKGEIAIDSLPGEGTTVRVRLPNSDDEGESQATQKLL